MDVFDDVERAIRRSNGFWVSRTFVIMLRRIHLPFGFQRLSVFRNRSGPNQKLYRVHQSIESSRTSIFLV